MAPGSTITERAGHIGVGTGAPGTVYGTCVLAMLAASAVRNITTPSYYKKMLRRADRIMIFAMIGGTYTSS